MRLVSEPSVVKPIRRLINMAPDAAALYSAVSDRGTRDGTVLFESAATSSQLAEKSIVVVRTALLIEGRGGTIRFRAETASGVAALERLVSNLGSGSVESNSERELVVTSPLPPRDGADQERLTAPSPLDALRAALRLGPRVLLAGTFAYDLIDHYENLPPAKSDPLDYPDFLFRLPEVLVRINHVRGSAEIIAHAFSPALADELELEVERLANFCQSVEGQPVLDEGSPTDTIETDLDRDEYATLVAQLKSNIEAGDVFQIVPSRSFQAACSDPWSTYLRLRATNPSPYMFYLQGSEGTLLGASPETCVRVDRKASGYEVLLRPIAGTRPRGFSNGDFDAELDTRLEAELRLCEKELAEHMMLVDLARNDLARISEAGTRRVSQLLTVERYSHVMHLVSTVVGTLRNSLDALHAYAGTHNMGTLVGAPKPEAARLLRAHELTKRGPFGGAVGHLSADGCLDTAIVIRSAFVRDGVATIRAGAGVVHDSDPLSEADETLHKARAVLGALR